jgi:hypothetical protein
MYLEDLMDILVALEQEEAKLQRQSKGIQGAIIAERLACAFDCGAGDPLQTDRP